MCIPVKWATYSGGCGPALEHWTQGKVIMTEVDHFRQEECVWMASQHHSVSFISFPWGRPDSYVPVKWASIPVRWSTVPVEVGHLTGCGQRGRTEARPSRWSHWRSSWSTFN